jgi:hypothetical protein
MHERRETLRVADVMVPRAETLHTAVPAPLGPDDVVAPASSAWSAFLKTGRHRVRCDAVLDDGPESRAA